MKQRILLFSLLVTLFTTLFPTTAFAQEPDSQYAIFTWRNDGDFNAFLNCDVDSIRYSKFDLNGRKHPNVVVQEVWTHDSVYRIPLTAIDSVTFSAPEPVMKDDVFHITEFHFPYVTDATALIVTFNESIPADSLPCVGQVVVSDIACVEPFENGFAGRVTRIVRAGGTVRIECEEVTIEDIYDELVCVGKSVSYIEDETPAGAPKRIIVDMDGVKTFPLKTKTIELISSEDNGESGYVNLNVTPEITLKYEIYYNSWNKKDNKFKCTVSPALGCNFDFNWKKTFSKSYSKGIGTITIPTKVPLLFAEIDLAGFLDLDGTVDLGATFPFRVQANADYDSQREDNAFLFNFNGTGAEMPTGYVELNGNVYAGLSVSFVTFIGTRDLASAYIEMKAGPQVNTSIRFNNDPVNGLNLYNNFSDSKITFEPLVAQLSAGVKTLFTDEDTWESPQWSVFNKKEYHLFPSFTAPELSSSSATLTTDISNDLLFPVRPGIALYQNNQSQPKYTYLSNKTYRREADWNKTDLQMELQQYSSGTYTAKPVFVICNTTVPASPTSSVTIPEPLSVQSSVTVKKGETQTIQFTGGWGEYTLTNSASSVCAAYVTGSSIIITGLKDGNAQLTLKDKRSSETKNIAVTVYDATQPPVITVLPDSINFGTVVKGYNATKTFTVTGSYLTGDITLSSSNHVFTINKSTLTPSNGTVNATVTVTYEPDKAENNGGYINIDGNGFERIRVPLKGKCEEGYINVNPSPLSFGTNLTPGKTYSKSLTVTTNVPGVLSSSYSETESGVFTVPSPIIAGNNTVKFMSSNAGSYSGVINIQDTKSGTTARVTMDAQVAAPTPVVNAAPDTVYFGKVLLGKTKTETITVTGSNLTSNLTVSSTNSVFTVNPTTLTPSNGTVNATVMVTYAPDSVCNNGGYVKIKGNGIEKKVRLSGTGVVPKITVSPTSYDFGTAKTGETKTKKFTVTGTNTTGNLTVTASETVSGVFSVTPTTLEASGGTVTVTYKPTEGGSYSGSFTVASANESVSAKATYQGKCAEIKTNKSSLDFGTLKKGNTKSLTFTVTGKQLTGDLNVASSDSHFTVSPTSLGTSGGTVTVTYNATEPGTHSGTITISGGGANSKTVSVTGKCAGISISPTSYDFGTAKTGETKTKKFTVTGTNTTGNLTVTASETVSGVFSVTPTTLGASGGTVTVTYKPTEGGSYSGSFTVASANESVSAKATYEGKCAEIITSKSSLDFGTLKKGNTKSLTFTVTGKQLTGNLTVASSNSHFTVSPTSLGTSGGTVTVTYNATEPGTHSGTITISGGGANSKTVSVTGKCAGISISPTSYDFGTTAVGVTKTKTFNVTGTNTTGTLRIVAAESVGGQFTVSPTTLPAAGGTVTVTFKPTEGGTHDGFFNVSSTNESVSAKATYTGKCPKITVSTTSLSFGSVPYDTNISNAPTKTFTVTGTNLTGDLSVTSNSSLFTVTPSTITASEAMSSKTVTVKFLTYKPGAAGAQSATITISGGGAVSRTVSVSGTCVKP